MGFLKYLPNMVSISRGLLVIPIVYCLSFHSYQPGFYLFLIAGLSDGIDGLLARRLNAISRFGSIVDPIADKLLLMTTLIALCWYHFIPAWLMLAVVIRDVWVCSGGTAYHFLIGRYHLSPSFLSKINTFFQIILVLAVLFNLAFSTMPQSLFDNGFYLVFITTVVSGFHYTWVWGKRAWVAAKQE